MRSLNESSGVPRSKLGMVVTYLSVDVNVEWANELLKILDTSTKTNTRIADAERNFACTLGRPSELHQISPSARAGAAVKSPILDPVRYTPSITSPIPSEAKAICGVVFDRMIRTNYAPRLVTRNKPLLIGSATPYDREYNSLRTSISSTE